MSLKVLLTLSLNPVADTIYQLLVKKGQYQIIIRQLALSRNDGSNILYRKIAFHPLY